MAVEIKDPTTEEIAEQKKEIEGLIERVFRGKKAMTFDDYKKVIKEDTSEMLLALMQIIHSNLPCAATIFQMKKQQGQRERKTETIAAPKQMSNYFFLNPVAIEVHKSQIDAESKFTLEENSALSSQGSIESPENKGKKLSMQLQHLNVGESKKGPIPNR